MKLDQKAWDAAKRQHPNVPSALSRRAFQRAVLPPFSIRMKLSLRFKIEIPLLIEHIPTTKDLVKGEEHVALVQHMLKTGEMLMHRDAPAAVEYRFGFHRPPFNSINHLHLHCMALPYNSRWRAFKYLSLGSWGGYVDANKLLRRLHLGPSNH